MNLYDIDKMNILLENEEKEIISYAIGPIKRKYYVFLCCEKEGNLFLKISGYNVTELMEFLLTEEKEGRLIRSLLDKYMMKQAFVEAYKRRFVQVVKFERDKLDALIKPIANMNANHPEPRIRGLDGFSMDCYMPSWNKKIHIWCYSEDEYFRPLIELANYLMDEEKIDSKYRFKIVERR